MSEIKEIEIKKLIKSPYNVRRDNVIVGELAKNIQENGLDNPPIVRQVKVGKDTKYEIISGNRRVTACKSLKMKTVPCIVKNLSDEESIIHSLSENIMHENLSKDEQAIAVAIMLGRRELLGKEK